MDQGTAYFLSSLTAPLSVLIAALWNRHEVRVAAKKMADELDAHNKEVAKSLAANTAITEATHEEIAVIKKALNGDVK